MNCRQVCSLISAYIDGELAGVEMLAVKRHISTCEACAEEFESIREVKRLMTGLSNVAPQRDLAAVILSRLDEHRVPRYQRVLNSLASYRRSRLSPAVAALSAVGVALMLLTAGSITEQQPAMIAGISAPSFDLHPVVDKVSGEVRLASSPAAPAIPEDTNSSYFITTNYVSR